MAPVQSNNASNFRDLELIMDYNVRRVLSSGQPQPRTQCLSTLPVNKPQVKEQHPEKAIDNYSQPNPLLIPMVSMASISLALGSMVNSSVLANKGGSHSQLRRKAPGATATATISAARLKPLPVKPATPPKQPDNIIPSQMRYDMPLLTPAAPPPPKRSAKSTTSAFPDYLRLRSNSPNPADPSNGAAVRKAAIVWFRNDLRLHDNESLNAANNESSSVLPVYCFDPRDYGKSSSGFDKTGPYRATFLLQCVANLRANLREKGSDLVVRVGKPEEVLVELAKSVGADALYAHQEVSHDEIRAESKITAALKEEGVEAKFFWGSTLYHLEDLPFQLEDMPSNYGTFREKVQNLAVRQIIEAPKRLKGLPVRGSVEPGEIPTLLDLGLSPQNAKAQDDSLLILVLYVDDLLITGSSSAIAVVKASLQDRFDMTDLGLLHYSLGIEISQSDSEISLAQPKYALDLLARFHMADCKPSPTPFLSGVKLEADCSSPLVDATRYRQLVGSLIYLTHTSSDISYTVGIVSRVMQKPHELHWKAAKRILHYIQGSHRYGIHYRFGIEVDLVGYTDSDCAGDSQTCKPTSGYSFSLGSGPISWYSKKQNAIAISSTEAEYRGAVNAAIEAIWLQGILSEFGIPIRQPTIIYCDNQSTIQICRNSV